MRGVIVGCDRTLECLLPWWWEHYSAHNDLPVAFANFGMSKTALAWCAERGICLTLPQVKVLDKLEIPDKFKNLWDSRFEPLIFQVRSAYFAKPFALLDSPFAVGLWADLDCQINGSLEPLFHCLNFGAEIALVKEPRRAQKTLQEQRLLEPGEIYYNSGILLFRQNAPILQQWVEESLLNHTHYSNDQDALCRAIFIHRPTLIELPSLYNWMTTYSLNPNALIAHYCGLMKLEIIKKAYSDQFHRVTHYNDMHLFLDSLNMESRCMQG